MHRPGFLGRMQCIPLNISTTFPQVELYVTRNTNQMLSIRPTTRSTKQASNPTHKIYRRPGPPLQKHSSAQNSSPKPCASLCGTQDNHLLKFSNSPQQDLPTQAASTATRESGANSMAQVILGLRLDPMSSQTKLGQCLRSVSG